MIRSLSLTSRYLELLKITAELIVACHLNNSTTIVHVDSPWSLSQGTYPALWFHASLGSCAATDKPTHTPLTSTT